MGSGGGAIEMFLDINVQNGLEVAESPILNDAENSDQGIENKKVHLAGLVVLRNQDTEQSLKYIPQELDDLSFTNESEAGKQGG
jgi:hypothetical protein